MKLFLEIHRYAPELNTYQVLDSKGMPKGKPLRCPGLDSIKAVRAKLYAPLGMRGRYVNLTSSTGNQRQGFCNDLHKLQTVLRGFRAMCNLPGTTIKISSRLVG